MSFCWLKARAGINWWYLLLNLLLYRIQLHGVMFVSCSGRVLSLETPRHGSVYTACPWSQHDERRVRFVYSFSYASVCHWHTVVCLWWQRLGSDSSSFSRHQTGARSVFYELSRTIVLRFLYIRRLYCSTHSARNLVLFLTNIGKLPSPVRSHHLPLL